jgi:hypothetical protein
MHDTAQRDKSTIAGHFARVQLRAPIAARVVGDARRAEIVASVDMAAEAPPFGTP